MSESVTSSSVLSIQDYQSDGTLGSSVPITVAQLASAILPQLTVSTPAIASSVVQVIASEQGEGLDVTLATIEQGSSSLQLFSALENYLPLAGGALDGSLYLAGLPTEPLHAAPKSYVDSIFLAANGAISNLQSNLSIAQGAANEATAAATQAALVANALTSQTSSAVANLVIGGVPSGSAELIGAGSNGNLFSAVTLAPTLRLDDGVLSVVAGLAGTVVAIDANGNAAVPGTKVQIGTGSSAVTFEALSDGSVVVHATACLFSHLPTSAPTANASGYLQLWNAGGLAALA